MYIDIYAGLGVHGTASPLPPNGMVPNFLYLKHGFPHVTWFLAVPYGSYGFLFILVVDFGFLSYGSGMGLLWLPMASLVF